MGSSSVAYLSQSKYGKLGNRDYSGANKEIYQNKSNSFITGCSYGGPSNSSSTSGWQYTYDVEINGTGASTTGTIYGVYDMSGGSWEYVMGNYNDVVGQSGFVSMPESKYYDRYTSNNIFVACNGEQCLSHGLSETAGLYNDSRDRIYERYPWDIKGGSYRGGSESGVFAFSIENGAYSEYNTFRLVMSPNMH